MPDQINRQRRFNELTEDLQTLGTTHSRMGTDILKDLWEIYKTGLYSTEQYIHADEETRELSTLRFETFVEYCDDVVRPFYDPPDYFDKFKWVVERVFKYVHERFFNEEPIIIPFTEDPLTVDMLLEAKGWISKLIIISNKMEFCETDEQIDKLFFAGFEGDVEDVREQGQAIQDARIPIRIEVTERLIEDGRFTLLVEDIDAEQYNLIKKRMGRIFIYHMD